MTQLSAMPESFQTGDAQALLTGTEQQLADMVTHAGKPGFATSEFWVQMLTAPVTFGVTALVSWLVVHGVTTQPIADQVAPTASAALVSAVATWLARSYVTSRSALKTSLLAHVATVATAGPAPLPTEAAVWPAAAPEVPEAAPAASDAPAAVLGVPTGSTGLPPPPPPVATPGV